MVKTAIQLYTLRVIDEPLPRIVECVGEMAINSVEFIFRVAPIATNCWTCSN